MINGDRIEINRKKKSNKSHPPVVSIESETVVYNTHTLKTSN